MNTYLNTYSSRGEPKVFDIGYYIALLSVSEQIHCTLVVYATLNG